MTRVCKGETLTQGGDRGRYRHTYDVGGKSPTPMYQGFSLIPEYKQVLSRSPKVCTYATYISTRIYVSEIHSHTLILRYYSTLHNTWLSGTICLLCLNRSPDAINVPTGTLDNPNTTLMTMPRPIAIRYNFPLLLNRCTTGHPTRQLLHQVHCTTMNRDCDDNATPPIGDFMLHLQT